MAKNFENLRRQLSPQRRRRNKNEADRLLLEMTLKELRQGLAGLSQEEVAEMLEVTQGYVSKLERQHDMLLSRLYAYVEALGGHLEIRVQFADKDVRIKQFQELSKLAAALTSRAKTSA